MAILGIEIAIGVSILCGFIGGACGGVLTKWTLTRFTVSLEYRVAELEERVNREVKKRAQEASQEVKKGNKDLIDWAKGSKKEEPETLKEWQARMMLKNGG